MRLGVDGRKIPEAAKRGPVASFDHARQLGLSGLFFRTVLDLAPDLDLGVLRAAKAKADELGMYMEIGLAKVNPYALPEAPEIRLLGGGDTLLGFRRMMEACAAIGCRELWIALCGYKPAFVGKFSTDRFRTDVDWADQLAASEKLLRRLAPIARDLGLHLNLETHEELTSFEVVRLVEGVGPDVMGIVFDTANVLQRNEHPIFAARRVAPHVRQTHVKDAILRRASDGVDYQVRPCGDGIVDFDAILPILAAARPDLNLSIENLESFEDRPRDPPRMRIDVGDPAWADAHPDLTAEERDAFDALVEASHAKLAAADAISFDAYGARRPGFAETVETIRRSAAHLRAVATRRGLALT